MTLFFGKLKFCDVRKVPFRRGHKADHWSVLKKKVTAKDKALQHFDDFYQTVYGESWPLIRSALLKTRSKYMAVVNNFGDYQKTIEKFESIGAIDLRAIIEAQKKNLCFRNARAQEKLKTKEGEEDQQLSKRMETILSEKQREELKSVYPADFAPFQNSLDQEDDEEKLKISDPLKATQMRPLEEDLLVAKPDESRIIKSSMGIASSNLHEYVPATKIKGMDDWLLESDHYGFYNRGADFSVKVEKDTVLNFPEHLKIYTFEARNDSNFPSPRRGVNGVFDYYLMDGASILPVLALDLQPGDSVLDMCAAPGGKSLVALQTLMPRRLVSNDVKLSRVRRINDVIDEYFDGFDVWKDRLYVTNEDARGIMEADAYNKILVDVPCTTDRHVLHEDDNNIFKPSRMRERLQLPEVQSAILSQALKIVAPGGTVVYSTCSLSPIQNDGVVQMALKRTWEETQSVMIVMDMMEGLEPLRCLYKFGNYGLKYGHIVIPTKGNNWGPMYFCKIVRAR